MGLTIQQVLKKGIAAHKDGKLKDAEKHYRAILQSHPTHPHANHNLGVLYVTVNKMDAGLSLFKTALKSNSEIEQFWLSYIEALIKVNRLDKAKQVYKKAKHKKFDGAKLSDLEAQLVPVFRTNDSNSESPAKRQLDHLLELHQNGRLREAEELATSLSKEFPRHDLIWMILGAIFETTGRISDAINAHQTAVRLSPKNSLAHYNLGITLQQIGRFVDSEASFTKAIAFKPDFIEAYTNLGTTLQKLKKLEEAEASFKRAIALKPDLSNAHYLLGSVLTELARLEEAEASYNRALELKPGCPFTTHMLASLIGKTTPTAPPEYVERLFDNFAANFERTLIEDLEYEIPKRLAEIIIEDSDCNLLGSIIDLGCGTGLFGAEIHQVCEHLEGVDLSEKMLAEAKGKGIYKNLIQQDITDFLSYTNLHFDYFVSTDVFIYIGDLSDVFRLIKSRNKSGVKLAFSTEHHNGEGFCLERSGRYSHSKKYIEDLCKDFDCELSQFETQKLRKEYNQYIIGGLYLVNF